jgi:hypothetical protein
MAHRPAKAKKFDRPEIKEAVFAKAIIHNSEYQSAEECKSAIDRYSKERNQYFKEHPMRAEKKIWGEEGVPAMFNESKNCKDPRCQNRTHQAFPAQPTKP